jgi:serine phosphatase RsbU (regulator of sigma subunit)/Tfp pilus assembly protein PilF
LNNIGYVLKKQGEIDLALKYYHKSLKYQEQVGNKNGIASSLGNIAYVYKEQSDISKALEYFDKSLKIAEAIGDKESAATTLNNMGLIYTDQKDTEQARKYLTQSLKLRRELNKPFFIANSLSNIAYLYGEINDYETSLKYELESLKIKEEIGDKEGIALAYNNLGFIYDIENNLAESKRYFEKSFVLYKEIKNARGIAMAQNNLANVYFKMANVKEAKNNALGSMELAEQLGYPVNIKRSAEILSKIYNKEGNGEKALEMYKLFIKMKDSLNNEANQKAAIQQQAKYEYEKQKVLNDAEYEKQIAIEKQAKEKQIIITTTTAGGLVLVIVFLIFIFNRLRITKKQKEVIEQQKLEVEQQKNIVEHAHSQLEEKNQEIMDSITYAKRIQNAILPPLKVVKEYLNESFILYKPTDIVAGDFYWMETIGDESRAMSNEPPTLKTEHSKHILFAAADCTGHGVPGAMVSVVCNNALNRSVREYGLTDPGEILNKTRTIVIEEFEKSEEDVKDGMDIALCSLKNNTLKYAGAHNPLWLVRNGELIETKANKQPIGKFENPEPYTTHTIELQKGDTFYIFSDGYVDQFGGEKGKKFKAKSFRELLLSIQDKPMEKQKEFIDLAYENWRGNLDQIDDVCVIGVRI